MAEELKVFENAQRDVKVSFDSPEYVANVDGIGTLRLLEAIRILGLEKKTRIYQASTSELYGGMSENKNEKGFYDENSPFYPRSPYGVAKIYAYWITKNYREAHNIFACIIKIIVVILEHEILAVFFCQCSG